MSPPIALICDTHFGIRGDAPLFLDIFTKFFNEQFFPEIERRGIKTIIHLGDLVDRRKHINFKTFETVEQAYFDNIDRLGLDNYLIVGNHDTFHKNTNRVNSANLLFQDRAKIYSEAADVSIDGKTYAFIPWVNSENSDSTLKYMAETKASFAFGHLEIQGFEVARGVQHQHGYSSDLFEKFKSVFTGHFHHKHHAKNIYYLGTPYEMTFSDLNDPKGFHVFHPDSGNLEFIRNPDCTFLRITYNDLLVQDFDFSKLKNKFIRIVVENKKNIVDFERFLESVHTAQPGHVSIIEQDLASCMDVSDIQLAEDTATILNKYVDSLNMDEDKEPLKLLLHELHQEAVIRESIK